jgi:hypothetical protein
LQAEEEAEAEERRRCVAAEKKKKEEEEEDEKQQNTRRIRNQRAAESTTGLPPRESTHEPQRVLMAALTDASRLSKSPAPPAPAPAATGPCDKCDGAHATSRCPHFKGKTRDKHQDAWAKYKNDDSSKGRNDDDEEADEDDKRLSPGVADIVRQPGDGSCLFHSLSFGLGGGSNATALRHEIADYIRHSPNATIGGTLISDWVGWDSGMSIHEYADKMGTGSNWGGAIEIAVCAQVRGVRVLVYESDKKGGFVNISTFCHHNGSPRTVRLLYGGRVHYDALRLR